MRETPKTAAPTPSSPTDQLFARAAQSAKRVEQARQAISDIQQRLQIGEKLEWVGGRSVSVQLTADDRTKLNKTLKQQRLSLSQLETEAIRTDTTAWDALIAEDKGPEGEAREKIEAAESRAFKRIANRAARRELGATEMGARVELKRAELTTQESLQRDALTGHESIEIAAMGQRARAEHAAATRAEITRQASESEAALQQATRALQQAENAEAALPTDTQRSMLDAMSRSINPESTEAIELSKAEQILKAEKAAAYRTNTTDEVIAAEKAAILNPEDISLQKTVAEKTEAMHTARRNASHAATQLLTPQESKDAVERAAAVAKTRMSTAQLDADAAARRLTASRELEGIETLEANSRQAIAREEQRATLPIMERAKYLADTQRLTADRIARGSPTQKATVKPISRPHPLRKFIQSLTGTKSQSLVQGNQQLPSRTNLVRRPGHSL